MHHIHSQRWKLRGRISKTINYTKSCSYLNTMTLTLNHHFKRACLQRWPGYKWPGPRRRTKKMGPSIYSCMGEIVGRVFETSLFPSIIILFIGEMFENCYHVFPVLTFYVLLLPICSQLIFDILDLCFLHALLALWLCYTKQFSLQLVRKRKIR